MILDDVVLIENFKELASSGDKPVYWNLSAELIVDGITIPAHNVVSLDVISDYVGKISDYIYITIEVYNGLHRILRTNNSKKLKVRVIRTLTNSKGEDVPNADIIIKVYDGYLTENISKEISNHEGSGSDSDVYEDNASLYEVDLQLVDPGLNEFRLIEVSGVYRDTGLGNLIKGLLSTPVKHSDVVNYNVDLYPVTNNRKYFQVRIPDGTRLVNIANHLQRRYGLYSAGVGQYLSDGMWYVYPLLDTSRFATMERRAIIISVPTNEMVGLDNSYTIVDSTVIIHSTGQSTHRDDSDRRLFNIGGGIRAANSGNLIDRFRNHASGVTELDSENNTYTVDFDNREGILANINTKSGRWSNNIWYDSSKVITGMGSIIVTPWESSNPKLLYPGMPIRYVYKHKGKVTFVLGTLIGVKSRSISNQKTPSDSRYITSSILTIHVDTEVED